MHRQNGFLVFSSGLVVGILGGLIGLGGAEFRLPLLIGLFGFRALPAVILNKATSLVVVAAALPFRARFVPFESVLQRWDVVLTLLAGSLAGAWLGAGWATRMHSAVLHRVLAVLLVVIAGFLFFGHDLNAGNPLPMPPAVRAAAGVASGFGIGVVASLMGVAGGELLIPTIILLFGADIRLAGSLSLAVSLPTVITGFLRYRQDRGFEVLSASRRFVLLMAGGSICGAFLGSRLLGIAPSAVLVPLLTVILLISAAKVWRHP